MHLIQWIVDNFTVDGFAISLLLIFGPAIATVIIVGIGRCQTYCIA